ncbi:hypothetical protein ACFQ06_14525, partial [Tessaracoccus lubricantis]
PKPQVTFGANAFADAMPVAAPGLLGCKWITLVPANAERGLPTAAGLMVVCDAETGLPVCVMAAGALTALRTAAVTGACLRAFVPTTEPVAFVGTGTQARSHLRVLAALGYAHVTVVGRRAEALTPLQEFAGGLGMEIGVTQSREALRGARAIVTGLPIGLHGTQLDCGNLRDDVVLLPLDYASSVGPELAATCTVWSDDVDQFAAVAPVKMGERYPPATGWVGRHLGGPRPSGRLLCQNLGNAASDIVVAAEVAANAAQLGLGALLPR